MRVPDGRPTFDDALYEELDISHGWARRVLSAGDFEWVPAVQLRFKAFPMSTVVVVTQEAFDEGRRQ